ncbi:MAG TPA: NUDIX hydrolase [Pyrinomonadaceae bacterium]|nr:NUDIX hydrolase [Pyrinomonadaceae bacterium]
MDTTPDTAPEIISSEEVFRGRVVELFVDTVREGETTYRREVVRHPGGASAVPLFDDGTVALVKQYRHPPARFVLELPAGKLEPGESPEECARRELEEEVGVVAGRFEPLSAFYTTPGFCSERLWVFLATDLSETTRSHEDDEIIEVVRLPLGRALSMIETGEIEDSKTIIGLLLAARARRGDGAIPEDG